MASSGSITTSNSNGYRNVTFQWSVKSQSIANNTTTISWSIVGAQNGSDGWYYAGPFNLTIDGTKVVDNLYPSGSRIQLRAGTVVKTGETTLTHAANGTKSFSATLTAAVYDLNDRSVSSSWSLDAIPRQSSASIASSYNIGSSHSISISSKFFLLSSNFIQIRFGVGNVNFEQRNNICDVELDILGQQDSVCDERRCYDLSTYLSDCNGCFKQHKSDRQHRDI